ncbi:hypothetical protein M0805_001224, partial [Coniferiporia weirii]
MRSREVAYVVSQELVKTSSLLPSNKNRAILVHSLISSLGLLASSESSATGEDPEVTNVHNTIRIVRPRLASKQELCLYHDSDYIDFILNTRNTDWPAQSQEHCSRFGIEDDCPPFENINEYVQMVAGATLTAADALKSGKFNISMCW